MTNLSISAAWYPLWATVALLLVIIILTCLLTKRETSKNLRTFLLAQRRRERVTTGAFFTGWLTRVGRKNKHVEGQSVKVTSDEEASYESPSVRSLGSQKGKISLNPLSSPLRLETGNVIDTQHNSVSELRGRTKEQQQQPPQQRIEGSLTAIT
jgi:hypothetical protein